MEITADLARELLEYNPDTGIFTWKHRNAEWFKSEASCKKWNTRYSRKRAGGLFTRKGGLEAYRSIRIFGKLFLEHRLAWLYMTGELPPNHVDHINRCGLDNRWKNLRESDSQRNSKNASMHINNKSGYVGVCWNSGKRKWQANGKRNYKTYFLGLFDNVEDAAQAAKKFRERHGYYPGHGEELAHYHQ